MKGRRPSTIDTSMLRAFLLTAESGSMSRAGKELGVTQPAVSAMISRLESRLGVVLFERSERPMKVTSDGRALRTRVESIVAEIDRLSDELLSVSQNNEIRVRLGFSDNFGDCIAPELLQRLLLHTGKLSFYIADTPDIAGKLLNDEIDIAIATRGLRDRKDVITKRLFTEKFLVITPRRFEGRIRTLADLVAMSETLPVIVAHTNTHDNIQFERVLRQAGIADSRRRVEGNTIRCMMELVARGVGWTMMTPLGIWSYVAQVMGNIAVHDVVDASRSYYVMHKSPAYGLYAAAMARESLRILRSDVLVQIGKTMPQIAGCVRLDPELGAGGAW